MDMPAWFSLSAQATTSAQAAEQAALDRPADRLCTRAGQRLADAFAVAAAPPNVFAVGVNCCEPAIVADAVALAARVTGRPAVAYPNSGESWHAAERRWAGGASYDVGAAAGWVEAGARYVGGCCRVGPSTIAALARTIADRAPPR
jgi:homocysteine S-methyltransferase